MRPSAKTWVGVVLASVATLVLAWAYHRVVWSSPKEAWSIALGGATYSLRASRWLALLLLAPWLVYALTHSLADLPWQQRLLSLGFRLSFVVLLTLAVSRASRTEGSAKVCTVFMVDVSDSVPDLALEDARRQIVEASLGAPPDDTFRLVTFAKRPSALDFPAEPHDLPPLARHLTPPGAGAGTDLEAALELAYGLFPPGYLRRALLFSDGVETHGDVAAEANRARQFGVRVSTIPYRRPAPGEVALRQLRVPDRVKVGEPFEIVAEVFSSRAEQVRAKLFQGETLNGLDALRTLDLHPGDNEAVFRSVVRVAGEVTYRLALEPLGEDHFDENNRASVTIDVPGKPTVLYIEGEEGRGVALASALDRQGFDVDVRTPLALPGSLKELERFDFVVLSDTPADQVPDSAQQLLESYVRELGGGLLFAGGPNGYGPGGWYHTTMERLLPVRMDSERRKDNPQIALVLAMDRSGSMSGLPLEMAKQAARATVDTLSPDDFIEVIAFDSTPTRYVKMQPARNRSRIENDIARIQAGGGTEIFPALDAAYQDLSVTQARKKHVILLTDGRAPSGGLRDLVQTMAAESMTVTTVGLGNEVDDQLLSMIKEYGGGRYHKVTDPSSLPKIFTREAEMIAKGASSVDYFPVRQTAPADFLRGIDVGTAPLLGGYTATKMKPPPAQEVLTNPDHGDPVLARWHVGLGYALAWTSDVKPRWAVDWTRWSGWPQFWGQLVREHMRPKHRNELEMKTEVRGGVVHASVDAFTPDDRFDNGLSSTLVVLGPEPGGARQVFPMKQTAPGRYEALFPLERYGSFLLRAEHRRLTDDSRWVPVAVSYGHVSYPYPLEYASFEPNQELMRRVAEDTSGLFDPPPKSVLDPGEEKVTFHRDLWPRFVGAALVVMLLDLLVRRVRFFDRKFLPRRSQA